MDLQMPVMGGIEATKIIRDENSDVLDHKLPIITMTANAMKGDREMCMKAGMNDYISNPIPWISRPYKCSTCFVDTSMADGDADMKGA